MRNSRADVIAAALRVLDTHGLEFCSMRRVAAELDVQVSALYHHVADKQTLLALMADEIVRGVRGDNARELCHALRSALMAVRDGAEVVATASAYRLGGSAVEARFIDLVGEDGARTLLHFIFGHTQATQTLITALELGALPDSQGSAGDTDEIAPGTHQAGANTDPVAAGERQRASFDRGIEIILLGLGEADTATEHTAH